MNYAAFETHAHNASAVTVYRKVLADLLTPVSAYMRLSQANLPALLLESVEGGQQVARYSTIGINPRQLLRHEKGRTVLVQDGVESVIDAPYLDALRELGSAYQLPRRDDLPPFTAGLIGYFGYETIQWLEDVPVHGAGENDLPDALFMLIDTMMVFDHLKQEIIICHTPLLRPGEPLRPQYEAALAKVDALGELLHTDIDYQTPTVPGAAGQMTSNFTPESFRAAVEKSKDYIQAGDVYQVVLSQRFERTTQVSPLTLYRALRNINPSPYMFLLEFPDFAIIGASPEILVKVDHGVVEIRPIAGTRRRGKDRQEDVRLAEELLADEKERAEHVMLVDLGRNDVGKVSEFGSVNLTEFMVVEQYSHVMHIVSDVRGRLRPDVDDLDALFAGFPAGTVSGAPKIRAMEIIYELEPTRRGIYAGAVGYRDFYGNLNTCIAIRTLVMKDGVVRFQSGAGIVADSKPDREFEETLDKAEAIMSAVDLAERGLK